MAKQKKKSKTKRKRRKIKAKSKKESQSLDFLSAESIKKKYKIVDVSYSNKINKGTGASHGEIDYHYQNYSNIMDFLKKVNFSNICLFEIATIHLDIKDLKKGIFCLHDLGIFIKNIKMCLKSKDILIPVILNLLTKEGNHANILLINKKNKTIELYEPHGARTSSSELDGEVGAYRKKVKALRKFWKNILSDYKIINSVDYQKGTAFQMKQDPENHSGFCVTWTILFVHYRLLNPKLQLPILIKYLAKKITTRKLLQYAKYIEDNIKGKD